MLQPGRPTMTSSPPWEPQIEYATCHPIKKIPSILSNRHKKFFFLKQTFGRSVSIGCEFLGHPVRKERFSGKVVLFGVLDSEVFTHVISSFRGKVSINWSGTLLRCGFKQGFNFQCLMGCAGSELRGTRAQIDIETAGRISDSKY